MQAGNLRSALAILDAGRPQRDALDRIVLATDTPTGTGVMPLGMIKTIVEMSSLGRIPAADAIALATGNNARVLRREEGVLEAGRPADLALLHPPARRRDGRPAGGHRERRHPRHRRGGDRRRGAGAALAQHAGPRGRVPYPDSPAEVSA